MITYIHFLYKAFWDVILSLFPFAKTKPKVDVYTVEKNRNIVNSCPTLRSFYPLFWAKGGYMQTLLSSYYKDDYVFGSETYIFNNFTLNIYDRTEDLFPNKPIILVLHGLAGDYESLYSNPGVFRGYRVIVYKLPVNTKTKTRLCKPLILQNSDTFIIDDIVQFIRKTYPVCPLFLLSLSSACKLSLKYLSSTTKDDIVSAVCVSGNFKDDCINSFYNLKTPHLIISSTSDPYAKPVNINYKQNTNIINVVTSHGGHASWFENTLNDPWHIRVIYEYFNYFRLSRNLKKEYLVEQS